MELAPVTKKIVAFGSKQVFLPKFTIALIRTPTLSPYQAKFLVPLNFSKYDLRDYLYHAYNIRTSSIRSLIKQLPVRDTAAQPRHFFRPESEKYMVVEMEKPFVWPAEPKDWKPWGRKEREESVRQQKEYQGVETARDQRARAKSLRLQALKVLGQSKRELSRAPKTKEEAMEREAKQEAKKEAKRAEKAETKSAMPHGWIRGLTKPKRAAPEGVASEKQTAKKQLPKPKRVNPALIEKWEKARTPQILGQELRDAEGYARLNSHKSTAAEVRV